MSLIRLQNHHGEDTMSVRKRRWVTGKGETKEAWVVDYTDQDGDRHIQTFERKKEADDYHATVKVDIRHGIHTAPSKSPTVSEAAEAWIKAVEARDAERTTVRQYRQHVDLHIVPRIGRVKVAELTPKSVEKFRDELLAGENKMSRALARKVLTSLKSLLKNVKHGHVADGVSIKRNKRKEIQLEVGRDIPATVEIKRIVNAATDERLHALILTAALTGLRASELRGLRWKDLDLKTGELHVRQRADRYNAIGEPKSASSIRTIPLDPETLMPALKTWRIKSGHAKPDDFVFSTGTGAVEHHANMLRSVAEVMITAGLTDDEGEAKYGLHAFRHFFASWCINPKARGGRELPVKVVQKWLGHSSITLTMDVYGHLFPEGSDRSELAASTRALLA